MASHIATEEWQSFEVRMRRRRAERLVARAEAALEAGFFEDATGALDEARRLCPSLPGIDEAQARVASAAIQAQKPSARARLRRAIAIAAILAIAAGSGAIGWRVIRTQHVVPPPEASGQVPAAINAESPAPPAPSDQSLPGPAPAAGTSIRIETQQVPPVVISGATNDAEPPARPAFLPPRTEAASDTTPPPPPAHAVDSPATIVGTTGPTTPPIPSPSADVQAIAALGREQGIAAPGPPPDRSARLRETASPAADVAPAPVDSRPEPVAASLPPAIQFPKKPDDAALVRSILDRYADAYTRLDADAAKAVWPTVNRAALSRAFNGLTEQRIAFNDCSVDVQSTQARATCSGSTTWEPKIGGGARTDVRRWAFDLQKSGDGWVIRDARVQNR